LEKEREVDNFWRRGSGYVNSCHTAKPETRLHDPPTTATQPWSAGRRWREIRLWATRWQVLFLIPFFPLNVLVMFEKRICRIWFAYKLFALLSDSREFVDLLCYSLFYFFWWLEFHKQSVWDSKLGSCI
jgi:hypothetical protein